MGWGDGTFSSSRPQRITESVNSRGANEATGFSASECRGRQAENAFPIQLPSCAPMNHCPNLDSARSPSARFVGPYAEGPQCATEKWAGGSKEPSAGLTYLR